MITVANLFLILLGKYTTSTNDCTPLSDIEKSLSRTNSEMTQSGNLFYDYLSNLSAGNISIMFYYRESNYLPATLYDWENFEEACNKTNLMLNETYYVDSKCPSSLKSLPVYFKSPTCAPITITEFANDSWGTFMNGTDFTTWQPSNTSGVTDSVGSYHYLNFSCNGWGAASTNNLAWAVTWKYPDATWPGVNGIIPGVLTETLIPITNLYRPLTSLWSQPLTFTVQWPQGWDMNNSTYICEEVSGNGYRTSSEEWDDGNDSGGCDLETATVNKNWTCSGGSPYSPDVCVDICGNGYKVKHQDCDDGNDDSLDGWSSIWTIEDNYKCSQDFGKKSHCEYCITSFAPNSARDGWELHYNSHTSKVFFSFLALSVIASITMLCFVIYFEGSEFFKDNYDILLYGVSNIHLLICLMVVNMAFSNTVIEFSSYLNYVLFSIDYFPKITSLGYKGSELNNSIYVAIGIKSNSAFVNFETILLAQVWLIVVVILIYFSKFKRSTSKFFKVMVEKGLLTIVHLGFKLTTPYVFLIGISSLFGYNLLITGDNVVVSLIIISLWIVCQFFLIYHKSKNIDLSNDCDNQTVDDIMIVNQTQNQQV